MIETKLKIKFKRVGFDYSTIRAYVVKQDSGDQIILVFESVFFADGTSVSTAVHNLCMGITAEAWAEAKKDRPWRGKNSRVA